jgi:hypothetical protein
MKTCTTCVHVLVQNAAGMWGECHRFPPGSTSAWPRVALHSESNFCGEYEEDKAKVERENKFQLARKAAQEAESKAALEEKRKREEWEKEQEAKDKAAKEAREKARERVG